MATGVDIVEANIQNARAKYADKQPHVYQFYHVDIVDGFDFVDKLVLQSKSVYPNNRHDWSAGWDLIVSREFMQHVPNAVVERVLANFERTQSRYLLATNHRNSVNGDVEIGTLRLNHTSSWVGKGSP